MSRPAADVLGAEWIKIRSVRSTRWTVLVTAALTIAAGVLTARNVAAQWPRLSPSDQARFDPLATDLTGLFITQIGFGLLGVLAIGSEYATGQIRTTFTAVPRRPWVLAAKATAVAAIAFAVGETAAFGAFAGAQPILAGRDLDVAISDPGVVRALLEAGLFVCFVALVGLGLAAAVRHTAGAVTLLFVLVFVVPQVEPALPAPWDARVEPYLLPSLGQQMYTLEPGTLSVGAATGWCAVYAAVALGLASVLIARRDA